MSPFPAVDIDQALTGRDADLTAAVRASLERLGIVQIVNHGVPAAFLDEFRLRFARIFALPRTAKIELASSDGNPGRGWYDSPDANGRMEYERYSYARFDSAEQARQAGVAAGDAQAYASENVWPSGDPALREIAIEYRSHMSAVAQKMLALYGLVLGVDPAVFPVGQPDQSAISVNSYPAWTPGSPAGGAEKLLFREHIDTGAFTLLHQDGGYDGLQGQLPNDDWRTVPIHRGALLVFTGKLMARWTNGRMRPFRHRVVAGGLKTRQSTAYFFQPAIDVTVAPLAPFISPEGAYFDPFPLRPVALEGWEKYLRQQGLPGQLAAFKQRHRFVSATRVAS